MEVDSLTDADLRKKLMEYGVPAGPVTDSTRNVLQQKLTKVVAQNGHGEYDDTTEDDLGDSYTVDTTVEEVITTSGTCMEERSNVTEEYLTKKHAYKYETDESSYESSYDATPSRNYQYARDSYPVDSESLRRRPLGTPHHHMAKTEYISTSTATTTPTTCKDDNKKSTEGGWWSFKNIMLIVICIITLLLVLVYYHMEQDDIIKTLPSAESVSKTPAVNVTA